jgi:hypothetical protein
MNINTFEKHKKLMLEHLGINEGVDDPIIFKAVFMAGGPVSGKSYKVKQIGFEGMGFKVLNSDLVYENEMEPIFKYVHSKYGKKFVRLYESQDLNIK